MGKRISFIMDTKRRKIGIIILLLVFLSTIVTGIIATRLYSKKDNIKNSFYQSVNYSSDRDLLSFTIPKAVPKGSRFYLHVSGRMYMGNKFNVMSFHAFEEESQNFSWIKGKTYTYSLKSESLVECLLVFGFIDKNKQELLYAIHIYPDGTKSIEKTIHMQGLCIP